MSVSVRFGLNHCLRVDCQRLGVPAGTSLSQLSAATLAACRDPLGYPPLEQCVVPGDRVALALDAHGLDISGVVSGVIDSLLAAGVNAADISIVLSAADRLETDPRNGLAAGLRAAVRLVEHDPCDRQRLSYLATTKRSQRVYLNRELTDADCVVPVSCLRYEGPVSARLIEGHVFPLFSDDETLRRYREALARESDAIEAFGEMTAGVSRGKSRAVASPGDAAFSVLDAEERPRSQLAAGGDVYGAGVARRTGKMVAGLRRRGAIAA